MTDDLAEGSRSYGACEYDLRRNWRCCASDGKLNLRALGGAAAPAAAVSASSLRTARAQFQALLHLFSLESSHFIKFLLSQSYRD